MRKKSNNYDLSIDQIEEFKTLFKDTQNAELAKKYDLSYMQIYALGKKLRLKKGKILRGKRKPSTIDGHRICTKCKLTKPKDEFGKDKYYCKKCKLSFYKGHIHFNPITDGRAMGHKYHML